nr:unnamed protein product [Digitaria exilis]
MAKGVMAGAVVGSTFGALWFVLWHSLLQDVLASSQPAEIVQVQPHQTPNSCLRCPVLRLSLSPPIIQGQTPRSHPNPGNSLILSLSLSLRLSVPSRCFLPPLAQLPPRRLELAGRRSKNHALLVASSSTASLLPKRLGASVTTPQRSVLAAPDPEAAKVMARVGSGGESAEVGVSLESDPMLREDEPVGARGGDAKPDG